MIITYFRIQLKKYYFVFFLTFLFQPVFGQDLENFRNLQCSGPMPKYFVTALSQKIDADRAEIRSADKLSKRESDDFSAITNYTIQRLIKSGKLLYGDPLTNYANKILDKIKAASDDNLSHIQIYTLKSKEVNAFATHQGVIYLTVGLWGQVENEAQLANIIAHEITHVLEKHSLNTFVFTNDMMRNVRYGSNIKLSDYYKYSKDNEKDADKAGLKLALKAGYSADELLRTMDILLYSYLPIDLIPVDYSWLENDFLKIPDEYKLEEINQIKAEDDIDDEESTHPNVRSRKLIAEKILEKYTEGEGEVYIAGTEEEFTKVQDLARFGMLNMFILNRQYIEGLYHNRILAEKYPNNSFLKTTEAMMWYGLAKLKKNDSKKIKGNTYKKIEGDIQQLYYFFKQLTNQELSILATRQIWNYSLNDPENKILLDLRKEVLFEFVRYSNNDLKFFAKEFTNLTEKDEEIIEEGKSEKKSKYDKINRKKEKKSKSNFLYNAFVDLQTNEDFLKEIQTAKEVNAKLKDVDKEDEDVDNEDVDNEEESAEIEIKKGKSKKDENTNEEAEKVSLDSLMMLAPICYNYSDKNSAYYKILKTESENSYTLESFKSSAEKLNLTLSVMNDFSNPQFSTVDYNNFSLLYDFLGERYFDKDDKIYAFHSDYLTNLTTNYNTKYIALTYFYSDKVKREIPPVAYLLLFTGFGIVPLWAYYQIPQKVQNYQFILYDVEQQKPVYAKNEYFTTSYNKYHRNAHIYHFLNQLK